jgi:hypothetical protein
MREPAARPFARINLPLLALAVFALLAALWAGLLRLGWALPPLRPTLAMAHGPLMACGFFGTLVSLERAVGLSQLQSRWRWTYLGPAATGIGALLLTLHLGGTAGVVLIVIGSLVLAAAMLVIVRIHLAMHSLVMLLGALAWLAGNLLWLFGRSIPEVTLWWAAFLVLTIAGERLELSRLLQLSRGRQLAFGAGVALFLGGVVLSVVAYAPGARLASLGLLALALWLLAFDMARRTVRKSGLARYIAVSLLAGYAWLGIAGLLGLRFGGVTAGFQYDAFLHSLFVGFVFSMIFAHAPIILPVLSGLPLVFGRGFYAPFVLLQVSLILRVAGDLLTQTVTRQWGGLLNEVAILLFLGMLAREILRSRRGKAV